MVFKKSKQSVIESLSCLLKCLEGKEISIDLRNDNTIKGFLYSADNIMNLELKKIEFIDSYGVLTKYQKMFIRGSNIKYIHIPGEINMINEIQKLVEEADYLKSQSFKNMDYQSSNNKRNRIKMKKKANDKLIQMKFNLGIS